MGTTNFKTGSLMLRFVAIAIVFLGFANETRANCEATATAAWMSAKRYNFTLEAHALGPNCANSAIVLLVLDDKGVVQWSTTRLAYQNAMFQEGATDNPSMKAALLTWLNQGLDTKPQTTKDLPDWKIGKDQAERDGDGQFGFFAGDEVSPDFYRNARDENQPVFCFVQGIESTSCIAAAGPQSIYELGGFTFPG
jgi:hypothetical protein